MVHLHSAAALERRRTRARNRGFIRQRCSSDRVCILVDSCIAKQAKVVVKSMELHATHDAATGTPHHHARLASRAALAPSRELEDATQIHRQAGRAKHGVGAFAIAAKSGTAWADFEDDASHCTLPVLVSDAMDDPVWKHDPWLLSASCRLPSGPVSSVAVGVTAPWANYLPPVQPPRIDLRAEAQAFQPAHPVQDYNTKMMGNATALIEAQNAFICQLRSQIDSLLWGNADNRYDFCCDDNYNYFGDRLRKAEGNVTKLSNSLGSAIQSSLDARVTNMLPLLMKDIEGNLLDIINKLTESILSSTTVLVQKIIASTQQQFQDMERRLSTIECASAGELEATMAQLVPSLAATCGADGHGIPPPSTELLQTQVILPRVQIVVRRCRPRQRCQLCSKYSTHHPPVVPVGGVSLLEDPFGGEPLYRFW